MSTYGSCKYIRIQISDSLNNNKSGQGYTFSEQKHRTLYKQ